LLPTAVGRAWLARRWRGRLAKSRPRRLAWIRAAGIKSRNDVIRDREKLGRRVAEQCARRTSANCAPGDLGCTGKGLRGRDGEPSKRISEAAPKAAAYVRRATSLRPGRAE